MAVAIDSGTGGNLTIETGQLILQDGAAIVAGTLGEGNTGDLTVRATEVELLGATADGILPGGLFIQSQNAGNSGDLRITTRRLIVRDGANIGADTTPDSTGQAGNLTVNASESVEVIGGTDTIPSILSVDTRGTGNGGNLTIETGQLIVKDGAIVSASTMGMGIGGNLTIRAAEVDVLGRTANGQLGSVITT